MTVITCRLYRRMEVSPWSIVLKTALVIKFLHDSYVVLQLSYL